MKTPVTLLLAGMLGLGTAAQAQTAITLTSAGYTQPLGNDSIGFPQSYSPFATLLTPAANANWNFTQTLYNNNGFIVDRTAPGMPNPYPGSTFSTLRFFQFAGGLEYAIQRFYTLNQASLASPGERVDSRQALALGSTTGSPTDSLIFPVQNNPYNNPEKTLVFPATYASVWSSVARSVTNFNLTAAVAGLSNTPGERHTQRSRVDSVIGWGTVMLRSASNSGVTIPIPVLQVRSTLIVRDSFYLNGQPAPANLLSTFGLQQGQLDTTLRVFLYRAGETTPLIEALWEAPMLTGTPTDVYIHRQRLPDLPIGISNTPSSSAFILSPNPVRRGQMLNFPTESGPWNATVVNLTGQAVATQQGVSTGNLQALELPAALPAGTYFLQLQSGGKFLPAKQFAVID